LDGVRANEIEELSRAGAVETGSAVELYFGENEILVRRGQFCERRAFCRLSVSIDSGKARNICRTLILQGAGERTIDETIGSCFEGAGSVLVRRDNPCDDRP